MDSKTAFNPEDLLASYEKQGYIINRGILSIDGEPVYTLSNGPTVRMLYWPKRQSFEILTPDHKAYQVESLWPVDKRAPKVNENPWMDFKDVQRKVGPKSPAIQEYEKSWVGLQEARKLDQLKGDWWAQVGKKWKEEVDKIKNPKLEQLSLEADKQIIWGQRKIDENRAEALRCFDAQGWKQYNIDMPEGVLSLTKGNFMMSYFLKTKEFSIFIKDPSSVTLNRMGPELYRLMGVLNPLYAMKEIEAVLSLVPHEYQSNKTGEWVYYQSNGFDRYFIEKQ